MEDTEEFKMRLRREGHNEVVKLEVQENISIGGSLYTWSHVHDELYAKLRLLTSPQT